MRRHGRLLEDDFVVVSEQLCERYGEKRIHLVGQSWGSLLGVLAGQMSGNLGVETSGHRPLWEQPEELHELMLAVLNDAPDS